MSRVFLKFFHFFKSFFKILLLLLYTPLYVVVNQIYLHYFFASSLRLELVPSTSFLNVLTCTISSLVSVHFVLSIKLFCKKTFKLFYYHTFITLLVTRSSLIIYPSFIILPSLIVPLHHSYKIYSSIHCNCIFSFHML